MDFSLTDEQQAIQDVAKKFAREELAPFYQEREKTGILDRDLMKQMGSLGLIGSDFSEEYGGSGVDDTTVALIMEAIAYGDFNVSYIQLLASLLGGMVEKHASDELKQLYVPAIAAGETIIGLGLTEPAGGSDAANLKLSAKADGDDYILNGEKTSISMATQMDVIILMARTGEAGSAAHGVSAFLVPMDLPGIKTTTFNDVGTKVVGRGSVFFEDVRIPKSCMMGTEGTGFTQVMQGFDYSRVLIALQCIAAAQASLDETWQYVKERETFGMPLIKYQGVNFPLSEHETILEACRTLCYKAVWLRSKGLPHTKEAAMVKWLGPKSAVDAIHDCLLLHGHAGYSTDLPHQQRLRDVIGLEIGDGTSQIMKVIIAREIMGSISVQYK